MMIHTLLLLLSSVAPTQWGTSPFVDEDHQHDWVIIDDVGEGTMWWDRNSIREQTFDGKTYPVVLMRAFFGEALLPADRLDMTVAIDCQTNEVAEFEQYVDGPEMPEPVTRIEDPLGFGPLPGRGKEETNVMMRAVCGEDWVAS